jgi:hypothetical protein
VETPTVIVMKRFQQFLHWIETCLEPVALAQNQYVCTLCVNSHDQVQFESLTQPTTN